VVEVELSDGQQDSGKRQVRAEPAEQRLNARERPVDQRGVLATHAVQDTHRLHQTLSEETRHTQSGNPMVGLREEEKNGPSVFLLFSSSVSILQEVSFYSIFYNFPTFPKLAVPYAVNW